MARRKNITVHARTFLTHLQEKFLDHVWQHSAFKDDGHARLDITHHSALSDAEVAQIEMEANSVIRENLKVSINELERGDAEQKYGFRIYQGGVVPVNAVRIVKIGDVDVEACGGTLKNR